MKRISRVLALCCLLMTSLSAFAGKETTSYLEGQVVKGVISQAIIQAYPIVESLGGLSVSDTPVASAITRNDGSYDLVLSRKNNNQLFYIEMSVSNATRMQCDFHSGCFGESTGSFVSFGELVDLPADFVLSSVAQVKSGKIINAPISPLTHLQVNYARALEGGLSADNLTRAARYIEEEFALKENSLNRAPADITNISKIANFNEDDLYLGILSGAFAPFISTFKSDGMYQFPNEEVFQHAYDLTRFLLTQVTSGRAVRKLTNVETRLLNKMNISNQLLTALSIVEQPQSVVTREGELVTLQVKAQGEGGLDYQWQKGGSILPGQTDSQIVFNPVALEDAGAYSVVVSDSLGTVQSDFVDLTVNSALSEVVIVSQPSGISAFEGSSVTFNVEATGDGYLTYQWRKDGAEIDQAYAASYSINSVTQEDVGQYDVVVSNSVSSLTSSLAALELVSVIHPVEITQAPVGKSVSEGESMSMSVTATGGGTIEYAWYKDDVLLPGQNLSELSITNVTLEDQGAYSVRVSNEVSQLMSGEAFLAVAPSILERAELSLNWSIPTAREDGSELLVSDIAGYLVSYIQESGEEALVDVGGAKTTALTLQLDPGWYEFRVATREMQGEPGAFSAPLSLYLE